MFNFNETKKAIIETTPLYEDVANIIMDFVKPPTFEVGKVYYQKYIGYGRVDIYIYKVLKRSKCFITIQDIDKNYLNAPIKKVKIKNDNDDDGEYTIYKSNLLNAKNEWKEGIHKIIWKNYEPKVIRKGEELNHLLPKTKPPRLDNINGVYYEYPKIKAPMRPNPKLIKIQEEIKRKREEQIKLQKELDILQREESDILYADLGL